MRHLEIETNANKRTHKPPDDLKRINGFIFLDCFIFQGANKQSRKEKKKTRGFIDHGTNVE
jgi:hypothetical protein